MLASIRKMSTLIRLKVSKEQYFGKEQGSRMNWTGQGLEE